jgi:hypothetical protein
MDWCHNSEHGEGEGNMMHHRSEREETTVTGWVWIVSKSGEADVVIWVCVSKEWARVARKGLHVRPKVTAVFLGPLRCRCR